MFQSDLNSLTSSIVFNGLEYLDSLNTLDGDKM
jgi:hypothetical protein